MTYEGVTFNNEYWQGKSEAAFLKHEAHHGFTVEQLKEAYAIINPPVKDKLGGDKKIKT